MDGRFAYLDYNATAPVRPRVREAVNDALSVVGNPSSVHRHGRLVRGRVEEARDRVASLIGASPSDVVFTSGGTEANNLALSALQSTSSASRLLVSAIEHESVLEYARHEARSSEDIPVSQNGVVDLDALQSLLECSDGQAVVSVMLANNETGVIQPIEAIVAMARDFGALVHCDAIQAVGKIDVDFNHLGVHALSISAHKFGGPQGVGALVIRGDVPFVKASFGGGQELGRRAGTENAPGIIGFGVAAEECRHDTDHLETVRSWRDKIEASLRRVSGEVVVYGRDAERLPTTTCLAVPGWSAETQVIALDLAGVSVSAGSACSSGKVTPSHVLRAMGAGEAAAASAIRVSLGWDSCEADADRFIDTWSSLYRRHTQTPDRKSA